MMPIFQKYSQIPGKLMMNFAHYLSGNIEARSLVWPIHQRAIICTVLDPSPLLPCTMHQMKSTNF
jgi:hypothetical protein